jgi:hypothetical protein
MKYTCPCCGYKTLNLKHEHDVCTICLWEDNLAQSEDPDSRGGTNKVSLKQAQKNFIEFGACNKNMIKFSRKPDITDIKDENWQIEKI